jgi:hypothetical protein
VLAQKIALTVLQTRELRRERVEVWELFYRHRRSYRHGLTRT